MPDKHRITPTTTTTPSPANCAQDFLTTDKHNWPLMRGMLQGVSSRFWPVVGGMAVSQAAGKLILFRTIAAGAGGRGVSSMLPNYSYSHFERDLVWYMRQKYM